MFQFDPSAGPWAHDVNEFIKKSQEFQDFYGYDNVYAAFVHSFLGDPLIGDPIPNTNLLWEDTSECQGFIYNWYISHSVIIPEDFQAILDENVGPRTAIDWWNYSYVDFGFVPGKGPSPHLHMGTVIDQKTAASHTGILPPA